MIITWEGNGSLREHSLFALVMIIGEPVGSPPQVESEMRVEEREGSGLSPPLPNGGGSPQNPYHSPLYTGSDQSQTHKTLIPSSTQIRSLI